jgi:hypothetical protein
VNVKCYQIDEMHFLYASLVLIKNVKTSVRKGLILYNNTIGITTMQKHVYVDYCMIAKISKKVNNLLKKPYENQLAKIIPHVNGTIILNFFATKD